MTQGQLDVVGAQEAAHLLGIHPTSVSRWQEKGKMPPTVADLRATPVWERADIMLLKRRGVWSGEPPKRLKLVGLAESAAKLDVDPSQIGRWRREGKFPEPALEKRTGSYNGRPRQGLGATPLWWEKQIDAFAAARMSRGGS